MAEKSLPDIVWEEPPADGRGPRQAGHLEPFAAALRDHPGQWARYPVALTEKSTSNAAVRIKTGSALSFGPAGAFEAVTRNVDGTRVLYVRYVGEPAAVAS